MAVSEEQICLAYKLLLNRAPAAEEVQHHYEKKGSLVDLVFNFLQSKEFVDQNSSVGSASEQTGNRLLVGGLDDKTLVHIHIPKTAGTSLSAILASGFPENQRSPVNRSCFEKSAHDLNTQLQNMKFIFGHIQHGIGDLIDQKVLYICTLRRPGPRLLSYYNFIRNNSKHHLHETLTKRKMSFGDFLKWSSKRGNQFRYEVDNGQVRLLAGQDPKKFGHLDPNFLHTSISNLLSPNMIYGLTEHFPDFIETLASKDIVRHKHNIRKNVSTKSLNLEAELNKLTQKQRVIYDSFIYWDNILYDVAESAYFRSKG